MKLSTCTGWLVAALLFCSLSCWAGTLTEGPNPPFWQSIAISVDDSLGMPTGITFTTPQQEGQAAYPKLLGQLTQTAVYLNGKIVTITPRNIGGSLSCGPWATSRSWDILDHILDGLTASGTPSDGRSGKFKYTLTFSAYGLTDVKKEFEFDIVGAGGDLSDINSSITLGKLQELQAGLSGAIQDQPVNDGGFWASLFVPTQAKVSELKDSLTNWGNLVPVAVITEFRAALSDPGSFNRFGEQTEDGKRLLHWGTIRLPFMAGVEIPLDMEVSPWMPWLFWVRTALGMGLWCWFALTVYRRFIRVVS